MQSTRRSQPKGGSRRWQGWGVASFLTVGILLVGGSLGEGSHAQAQLLDLKNEFSRLGDLLTTSAPTEVQSGWVSLDGRRLFVVTASPQAESDDTAPGPSPLTQRIQTIESNLEQVLQEGIDPDTLTVAMELDSASNQPIILVNGRYIMTVTYQDAQFQGLRPPAWSQAVTNTLRATLITAAQERQPQRIWRQVAWAGGLILVTVLVSTGLEYRRKDLHTQLLNGQQTLLRKTTQLAAVDGDDPQYLTWQEERTAQQHQIQGLHIQQRLIWLGQGLVCAGCFTVVLGLFPYSRSLQTQILTVVLGPLFKIGFVATVTSAGLWLCAAVINRFITTLGQEPWILPGVSEPSRRQKRLSTLSAVAKGGLRLLVVIIGSVTGLGWLGVSTGPLLASVGVVGLGISLAAQDLIKDIINGLLILVEDQYAEGDVIEINGKGGLVENLNLRVTQLRNPEGTLITIPNSSVRVVENLSNGWARVDLGISVAYETDLDQAIHIIESVALDMSRDPEWRYKIIDRPDMLGVDDFGDNGIIIRLWIKVRPLEQWAVAREYRLRLKRVLDQAGIKMPFPQRSIWIETPLPRQAEFLQGE